MKHHTEIIQAGPAENRFRRGQWGWLPLVVCLNVPLLGQGAASIDWLTFSATANRTQFSLLGDAGQTVAGAQIGLTTGILAPLSPAAGSLQAAFWSPAPPFEDSVTGSVTLTTTKVQVAPQAAAVRYQLSVQAQDLSNLVFAVGQLFGSGAAGTREVDIVARTQATVAVPLDFAGVNSWDNGLKFYTQPLDWDGSRLSLSTDGESAFAFFQVPQSASPVTELVFTIPNGYAFGSGDALEFAFGMPTPEPGVVAMLLVGLAGMSLRRHRRASCGHANTD